MNNSLQYALSENNTELSVNFTLPTTMIESGKNKIADTELADQLSMLMAFFIAMPAITKISFNVDKGNALLNDITYYLFRVITSATTMYCVMPEASWFTSLNAAIGGYPTFTIECQKKGKHANHAVIKADARRIVGEKVTTPKGDMIKYPELPEDVRRHYHNFFGFDQYIMAAMVDYSNRDVCGRVICTSGLHAGVIPAFVTVFEQTRKHKSTMLDFNTMVEECDVAGNGVEGYLKRPAMRKLFYSLLLDLIMTAVNHPGTTLNCDAREYQAKIIDTLLDIGMPSMLSVVADESAYGRLMGYDVHMFYRGIQVTQAFPMASAL